MEQISYLLQIIMDYMLNNDLNIDKAREEDNAIL